MKRIFTYLDKFYTKNKQKGSLCTNGLRIYREVMINSLKEKLYNIVNNLIKNDRNCNISFRYKIKTLLKIFEEIDYNEPNIVKEKDNWKWEGQNKLVYIAQWFNNYFKKSTIDYIKEKTLNDINSKCAPEYIKSSLKYLIEEERKNEFILSTYFK